MTFKIGETVKLRSGGPTMTVAEINNGDVVCQWFDTSKGEVKGWAFHPQMLDIVVK